MLRDGNLFGFLLSIRDQRKQRTNGCIERTTEVDSVPFINSSALNDTQNIQGGRYSGKVWWMDIYIPYGRASTYLMDGYPHAWWTYIYMPGGGIDVYIRIPGQPDRVIRL